MMIVRTVVVLATSRSIMPVLVVAIGQYIYTSNRYRTQECFPYNFSFCWRHDDPRRY